MTMVARGGVPPPFIVTIADVVRRSIANRMLGNGVPTRPAIPERLGTIRLRPHQIDATARLTALLDESGGAMLADEVGLGKTYVALAIARETRDPVIVAPAALLPMWQAALERVRRSATLLSFERLSRAAAGSSVDAPRDPDIVIVDEAHHVRTSGTRRYAVLAQLCARSRVLLLSATPLQNSRRDLAAQLALFLGSAAWTMTDSELARFVVRRTRADLQSERAALPAVASPTWLELRVVDDCLDALLGLPPPVPASDGGDGGALLLYSLVRRWASSRAALRATLRRRLARATGLIAALEAGRYPSRSEVAAWTYAESSVQLAFPELVAAGSSSDGSSSSRDLDELLRAVQRHDDAVRAVLVSLENLPDPDVDRAQAIREIRARHPRERIIAFAEAAETVEVMFRLLRRDGGVAMLRARSAAVSGGALSRRDALVRFAPSAQGAEEPHRSQRIDLLLATDLLSEGVNLQDASVVIHLDLPWNPARLEQRVGRVSRLGSRHERVSVYAIRPPAASERLLAVERRLRAKLAAAGRALGVVGTILPGINGEDSEKRGVAEEWTRVHTLLRGWQAVAGGERQDAGGLNRSDEADVVEVAAVRSTAVGFLAMLVENRRPILLASTNHADPSTSSRTVATAIELASGADVPVDRRALAAATKAIEAWLARRAASELSGVDVGSVARARRRVLTRIGDIAARAPRHTRANVSALVTGARRAALMPLGAGGERVLAELADAPLADQAWLRAIAAFGDAHARPSDRAQREDSSTPLGLRALLLLCAP